MFGGGVSDKLGNDYELEWTLRQLLGVLRGEAQCLRMEGIKPEFRGFEFAVDHGSYTAWHQTKINNGKGNWTVNALEREGVLSAFAARLGSVGNDRCVFVSQSPAVDLDDLSGKARFAESFADFHEAIGLGANAAFQSYWTKLGVEPEVAFDWLRRTDFRTLPQPEIEAMNAAFIGLAFSGEAETVAAALRHYVRERLNRNLTTELLREELPLRTGLALKDWILDPTLAGMLRDETNAYLGSYAPFGMAGEAIHRPEAVEIVDELLSQGGARVVLLSGVAGSGKSGVIREVVKRLRDRETAHLALRIDQNLERATPVELGVALLRREESPVVTLKGVSPDAPSVLIVDQIDAVSEVSGRNGGVKAAIMRMVGEAGHFGSVRVLLACRSFDIESDERIKVLRQENGVREINVSLLDWEQNIEPILKRRGISPERFSDSQRELLRLPLHLSVFLEVAEHDDVRFTNRNDLFAKLLVLKERRISESRSAVPWSLLSALSTLAFWMSDRQRLDAPYTVLDDFPRAVDILVSEHLLVRNRDMVAFFHESFFDYVFARSFMRREQSVGDMLQSSEQHLFRRTQVRQILESMRQADRPRYLRDLDEIWTSDAVRHHVKLAVAQWLGALPDPTSEEAELVYSCDDPRFPMAPLPRLALLGSAGWFDLLLATGWIRRGLHGRADLRRRQLTGWLGQVCETRPAQVATLLEEWWDGNPERASELLDWFGFIRRQTPDQSLTALCERLIRSCPDGLFAKTAGRRQLFGAKWVVGKHGTETSPLLEAYFDAWYDRNPGHHPFEGEKLRDFDLRSLGDHARGCPAAAARTMTSALARALRIIDARTDINRQDFSFTYRTRDGKAFGTDAYLRCLREALRTVVAHDPDDGRSLLAMLDARQHDVAAHLHLETISANGEALAPDLMAILDSPHLLEAGWAGAAWMSFAEAARGALPHLDAAGRDRIESLVLDHEPELERVLEGLREAKDPTSAALADRRRWVRDGLARRGFSQYCILETIGRDVLSDAARRRLYELARKFEGETMPRPRTVRVHAVTSPIARDRSTRMNDKQWLRALERHHDDDELRRGPGFVTGGARQLGRVLNEMASREPARSSSLMRRIPADANPVFIDEILGGLADAKEADLPSLEAAVMDAYGRDRARFGNAIIRVIEQHPELGAADDIWSILLWYIVHGDAREDHVFGAELVKRESLSIDDLLGRAGMLRVRGLNRPRGAALEALAAVLWNVPERTNAAWEVVGERIRNETSMSIRCCLPRALLPLFNSDSARCAKLLERLVAGREPSWRGSELRLMSHLYFPPERLPRVLRAVLARMAPGYGAMIRRWRKPAEHHLMSPLLTHHAAELVQFIVMHEPDAGTALLTRMLSCGDQTTRLVATWQIIAAGFNERRYTVPADLLEATSSDAKQLAADLAAGAVGHDTFVDRATAKLRAYFHDENIEVRKLAGEAFKNIRPDQLRRFEDLSRDFVASPAFLDESFAFLNALGQATCNVADLLILAAERYLEALPMIGGNGSSRMDSYQLKELIKVQYAASENSPALRKRLLDVIDAMLSIDVSGMQEITQPHER